MLVTLFVDERQELVELLVGVEDALAWETGDSHGPGDALGSRELVQGRRNAADPLVDLCQLLSLGSPMASRSSRRVSQDCRWDSAS